MPQVAPAAEALSATSRDGKNIADHRAGWLERGMFLARRELSRRYLGSLLGWWWALIFPSIQLGAYLIALRLGMKIVVIGDFPLVVALLAAMVPWFFLNEALVNICVSISSNAPLLRNTPLSLAALPQASLAASFAVHLAILVLAVVALVAVGYPPGWNMVKLPYFMLGALIFVYSTGLILAIANGMIRDVSQMVAAFLALLFWITPITWPSANIATEYQWLLYLNPFHYIVSGYRYALLGGEQFAPTAVETIWFWIITTAMALVALASMKAFGAGLKDNL